jgi:hypothetical protein
MSSTWVIHFLAFFNLLDFAKSNAGAGFKGFYSKVGSIPASRTSPTDGTTQSFAFFRFPLSKVEGKRKHEKQPLKQLHETRKQVVGLQRQDQSGFSACSATGHKSSLRNGSTPIRSRRWMSVFLT